MHQLSSLRPLLYLSILTLFFFACSEEDPSEFKINPAFQKHISSFTSGVISAASPIQIQLTEPYLKEIEPNQAIKENLISISPEIKGKTVWKDQYTIEFIPDDNLKSGQDYWVEFDLGKVSDVPKELKVFKFPFSTIKQAINFDVDEIGRASCRERV